ncbi:hypothetical protein TN53_41490, partial [Streptomyces sp. WM6386]
MRDELLFAAWAGFSAGLFLLDDAREETHELVPLGRRQGSGQLIVRLTAQFLRLKQATFPARREGNGVLATVLGVRRAGHEAIVLEVVEDRDHVLGIDAQAAAQLGLRYGTQFGDCRQDSMVHHPHAYLSEGFG